MKGEVTTMFKSEKEIEIRYAETDQMGVVYHANYLVWMELGRTQLVKDLGFDYAGLEERGYLSPVLDLSVQYKKAMRYGQVATIRTWIHEHGKLRTTYAYEILHEDGSIAATGKSMHTLIQKENFRPVSLSRVDAVWDAKYKEVAEIQ